MTLKEELTRLTELLDQPTSTGDGELWVLCQRLVQRLEDPACVVKDDDFAALDNATRRTALLGLVIQVVNSLKVAARGAS